MIAKNAPEQNDFFKKIKIVCPDCNAKKSLKIPSKIINKSKLLTTVSIPTGLCCDHNFQAFIDKNFQIRGYQQIDFDFSKMEIYESNINGLEGTQEADVSDITTLPLFQQIITILREAVDDVEVLGSGIFTIEGNILYSSLPQGTLFNIIREFEVRSEKMLPKLKKMFLELENNQKITCNYMKVQQIELVLVLFFSESVKLGMGNLFLREISTKIKALE